MSKTAEMRTLTLGDTKFKVVDGVAVHTVPQDLTESEKEQARENIGAATVEDVLDALPVYNGEVESL